MLCVQEMKTLDKEVRVWDVYAGLESTVKNLLTSLRAVNELQNPAVRERHWQQLMHTTGVEYIKLCTGLQNYTLPQQLHSQCNNTGLQEKTPCIKHIAQFWCT